MAKDVKRVVQQKAEGSAADHSVQTDISPAVDSPQPTQQAPVLLPSTVINLAVHSLLMLTVPFVLFFATSYGALDSLFTVTGAPVPRQQVKYYLGAGLAVLGVNLVIASFVVAAFKEQVPSLKKTE